ncbi:hypothetical protein HEK616_16000 [Streptomyces nigrescens]|uniref:Alanine-rich protein n=1 Tax=Streptomyces nigrescens TaxID=1920 RepID=A0ABM7ZQ54_STRNI|nr:hypothetical protein [Streptomyces nigrescens]BDM68113.1 hypothetical protein HEK616_16000 [Streptomyces nigrescens]
MRAAAFLYPWDVIGDPDAPARLAGLGIDQVALAAAYHSTRALTPRHPRHRIVTARHSAVLYPPDPARWAGRELCPYTPDWVAGPDPFGAAARALADAGLEVHSWVVLAHNSRLGAEHPSVVVRNAYGDAYPWAPCIARPEVRGYLVDLAAEAAVRPGARGTELESCGWYGLAHLHAHDKIAGVPLSGAAQYLMSVCFCPVCAEGYRRLGASAEELRAAVVRALEPLWSAGTASPAAAPTDREGEWAAVEALLGAEPAGVLRTWRDRAARRLRRAVVGAVRAAAPDGFRVLLHADPAAHRCGANPGVDPAQALADADGVVLPCTGGAAARAAVLGPFAGPRPAAATVAANLTIVSGMGGSPRTLAADAAHAARLGADEVRLYHAGLAGNDDLTAVREALAALRGRPGEGP